MPPEQRIRGGHRCAGARRQPDIRNGYLRFCRDQTELLRQLEQFPLGRHDDGPDALEGAVRLCKQGPRLSTAKLWA